ncbi:hypothetical protein ACFL2V_22295 [Pseudomonadota bacterium]
MLRKLLYLFGGLYIAYGILFIYLNFAFLVDSLSGGLVEIPKMFLHLLFVLGVPMSLGIVQVEVARRNNSSKRVQYVLIGLGFALPVFWYVTSLVAIITSVGPAQLDIP